MCENTPKTNVNLIKGRKIIIIIKMTQLVDCKKKTKNFSLLFIDIEIIFV